VDLEQLQSRLIAVVQETKQPEDVSLWQRASGKIDIDGNSSRDG
jgi:hypothetical protein